MTQIISGLLPEGSHEIGPDATTAPFWAGAKEHKFLVQQCSDCAVFRYPPQSHCASCRSENVTWSEATDGATLYSFTIVRHPVVPEFATVVPYVIAVVDINAMPGVRVLNNVVNCDLDTLAIGQQLDFYWHDVDDEVTIPRFTPKA